MGSEIPDQLHVVFLPFMGHGHMIPMVDLAKLFARKGVKTTIVTTPLNLPFISNTIQRSKDSGINIDIRTLEFPCVEAGLPQGCENLDSITTSPGAYVDMLANFFKAADLLQQPFEQLLQQCKPDCLVADTFFSWAHETAAKLGIPRLCFDGSSFFSLCVMESIFQYEPHKKVAVDSDSEPFLIPNLPGDIKMTPKQMPPVLMQNGESPIAKLGKKWKQTEAKSYGVVVNSFYELEATYVDHCRNVWGRKVWHVGPVSLCNGGFEDKAVRGMKASIDAHECLKWLDSKRPNSVVYICFGSATNFSAAQLMEIALGIETSGQQFIWVVRKEKEGKEDWLPQGFEQRMEGKGLIIRGWAPQVLILDHQAVGGFVTHCGWNSVLEAVSAGVPMVTWPVFAEQFYNEKQVTQILKIGVGVGAQKWVGVVGDFVKRDAIEKAVKEIMVGERAEEMRSRAKALAKMAKTAVEEGGSSYNDLNALIQELTSLRSR